MDRNTIIGLLLIFIIVIVYSIYTAPTKEEIEAARRRQDSLQRIYDSLAKIQTQQKKLDTIKKTTTKIDSLLTQQPSTTNDSIQKLEQQFGIFAYNVSGNKQLFTLENNLLKVQISTQGGKIYSVELKEFRTHDSLPLILFTGDSNIFDLNFFALNRSITTDKLFFTPLSAENYIKITDKPDSLCLRLYAEDDKYIEYVYTIKPNSYLIDFDINIVNLENLISENITYLGLNWEIDVLRQEKNRDFENNYTTIHYKFLNDEVEKISPMRDGEAELTTKIRWIAFKQQFFASIFIAHNHFINAFIRTQKLNNKNYLKRLIANISIPYQPLKKQKMRFHFYFGPNHFNTLSKYSEFIKGHDLAFQELVPLGWGIFGWINRFAVSPVFTFLDYYRSNYGIIILILTILLKIVLFPLTYKSYLSSAKMRVLKPQVEEINKKFPKDKALERQQAIMKLYRRAGVNPMGGCIPILLQFPILIAMFRFFPASIELRQKSFLWADDLSSYDSILDLPFNIPFYGDHISLFCLLMTITNILYTRMTNKMNAADTTQMPGMKTMMYLMPIMFLFFFNNYAAGLSYYYFIATLLTFAQMAIIKRFVNDKEVLRKLEEHKKKPVKKSRFQQRLEEMAKKRGYRLPK